MFPCCKGHLVRPYLGTILNDVNNAMLLSNQIETVEKKDQTSYLENILYYILTKVRLLLDHSCVILISFKIVVVFNITLADFVLM